MARTIVQEYGPIYGEAVNGTVMGRPNGSVFVPTNNTISLSIQDSFKYLNYHGGPTTVAFCISNGDISVMNVEANKPDWVAVSQDLANYIQMQVYSDAGMTTKIAYRDLPAGLFNVKSGIISTATPNAFADGDTLYVRAQLMSNGIPVATSDTIEVTGVRS